MDRMKDDYKDIVDCQFDKKKQIAFTTVQSCVYTDHRKPESLDGVWGVYAGCVSQRNKKEPVFCLWKR